MSGTNSHLSLISLNIDGLNSPIKRHKLADWIHKQDPAFCCIEATHLNNKDRHYFRAKGYKKSLPSKWSKEASRSHHPNIQ
jgi:exonuclease III